MTVQPIEIPDSIKSIAHSERAASLIDDANDRIEAFLLADQTVIEDFLPCDFHRLDQSLEWIEQNGLTSGKRFCELGSGFGIAAMLAAIRGMEAVGIEIEPALVEESNRLADDLDVSARFFAGSFVPRDATDLLHLACEIKQVESEQGDVYEEMGQAMKDFDLIFAYPWPGDHPFLEAVFDAHAGKDALLLTYRGRKGMSLLRKVD